MAKAPARPPATWAYWDDAPTNEQYELVYTKPANALRTAQFMRSANLRRASRYIAPGERWDLAAKEQGWTNRKLAAAIKRVALKAKAEGGMVAFKTETGGYPWRVTPYVWRPPSG